jgi:RimJ/RimL family protein N-acetyltransferase
VRYDAAMSQIWLKTARLALRQFAQTDLEALAALDADPEVMRYLNGGRAEPFETIRDKVLPHFLAWHSRDENRGFWAAESLATGEFLGWFHFRPPHEPDVPGVELGYRLRQTAWGQGFATEGARAIIHHAFNRLDVERVIAKTLVANVASQRVMQKAGMSLVETFAEHRIEPPQAAVWYAIDRQPTGS